MDGLNGYFSKNKVLGNVFALSFICLLGVAVYGHTLHVPWYLDDIAAIVENRTIHDLPTAISQTFSGTRGIADLTFAFNYHFTGTEVVGYHLVNILVHLITACLVFLIFKRIFRDRELLALAGALIFVAHPLQTQAVTYIVQRMTSLAALFFFLAIYLFILFREHSQSRSLRWLYYALALLSGALAIFTKQNTAVLPLALLLLDRYFLQNTQPLTLQRSALYASPFALAPLWLGVQFLLLPMASGSGLENIGGMPDLVHLRNNTPLNYLVTQFSVVFIYLRFLIFPYGQALDYDVPIVTELLTLQNATALLGILVLFAAAIFLRRRNPWISAGILWIFLGLAVESTLIPLDPVFEHRIYISMFGFAMVVLAAIMKLPQRIAIASGLVIIAALSILTWQRNNLWNDPVAFAEDNLRRAPMSERVHLDLANAYMKNNRISEAQQLYERALEINPDYVLIHINLSRVYAAQKDYQKGVDILLEGLRRNPNHFRLHNNLAVLYNDLGKPFEALAHLQKGVALEPYNARVHFNLAIAYERIGRREEAIAHYRQSIALDPSEPMAYFNLGLVQYRMGEMQPALQSFMKALELNPLHAGTWFNAAMTYLALGDVRSAQNILPRLQGMDRNYAQRLQMRLQQSSR